MEPGWVQLRLQRRIQNVCLKNVGMVGGAKSWLVKACQSMLNQHFFHVASDKLVATGQGLAIARRA